MNIDASKSTNFFYGKNIIYYTKVRSHPHGEMATVLIAVNKDFRFKILERSLFSIIYYLSNKRS